MLNNPERKEHNAMKKLVLTAIMYVMSCAVGMAQTTNTTAWTAPVKVTQVVSSVKINAITIQTMNDNKIQVMVNWMWLDDKGKPVRNGTTRYTHEQIAAKLAAKGSSVDSFRQLFLAIAAEEAVAP